MPTYKAPLREDGLGHVGEEADVRPETRPFADRTPRFPRYKKRKQSAAERWLERHGININS